MEYSFLLIKPDTYNRDLAEAVREDIVLGCQERQLTIVVERTRTLTVGEVLKIYPTIFEKSFPKEFISLMVSNSSTLFLVAGDNAIAKTKEIRGYHKFNEEEETRGIRGKYCYVEDVSQKDLAEMKTSCHPRAKHLIAVIIEGVVHAPDTSLEVSVMQEIFNDGH